MSNPKQPRFSNVGSGQSDPASDTPRSRPPYDIFSVHHRARHAGTVAMQTRPKCGDSLEERHVAGVDSAGSWDELIRVHHPQEAFFLSPFPFWLGRPYLSRSSSVNYRFIRAHVFEQTLKHSYSGIKPSTRPCFLGKLRSLPTTRQTLVLYRMRPIVEVRRWALCWGRVRYSGLKEAAPGEAIMPIQSCWG